MLLWTWIYKHLFEILVSTLWGLNPEMKLLNSIFNFQRNWHTVFHSSWALLHVNQQYTRVLKSPRPGQYLLFLFLFIYFRVATLREVRLGKVCVKEAIKSHSFRLRSSWGSMRGGEKGSSGLWLDCYDLEHQALEELILSHGSWGAMKVSSIKEWWFCAIRAWFPRQVGGLLWLPLWLQDVYDETVQHRVIWGWEWMQQTNILKPVWHVFL